MTKTKAMTVLRDPTSTEDDKKEARVTLGIATDGSADSTVLGASSNTTDNAGLDPNDPTQAPQPGQPTSQTGNDNAMDSSNSPLVGGDSGLDSFPNTGESATINQPAIPDVGAAAGAASSAVAEAAQRDRPALPTAAAPVKRSALSGEVDSVTTVQSAEQTAVPNAVHATQRYMDDRGYSNTREFPNPQPAPTVHVPVSNMVSYVDDTGSVIGMVERGQEASEDSVIVVGGKEWIVTGGTVGSAGNTIPVRQNLPQAVN